MDVDNLLKKHSDNYRFHGVRSAMLTRLIEQAEDNKLVLWGTEHDEHIYDVEAYDCNEYVQGEGYLYVTNIKDIDMSFREFTDDGGLVLVLEKKKDDVFEHDLSSDRRQHIVKVQDWDVIGGIRAVDVDEDGDVIEQEAFSILDIIEGNF